MSPVATGGVLFLAAIAYALIAHFVATLFGGWRKSGAEYVAIFWPLSVAVVFVWFVMLKPWGWAFRLAERAGERLSERLKGS
jgi:hypothetical protein